MRKVVVQLCVSLDGFIEGPHGELDWHLVDEELHSHFNQYLGSMGAFLNGRVMHELMVGYWPTADQDPDAPAPIVEFARIWREMPKLVYSRTLPQTDLDWNARVVREVVPEEVRRLKAEPGGDLALGGADLASAFLRHGLIDEYRLYIQPVVLGAGKPLFPQGTARTDFRLLESRTFGNGVELLRYQCAQ
ncbi:dihydrofolate reductase family protein [Actinocrinis sp.]|jgi:dihydrofolate reductase|uniref:dihydrofolate reductase family protein n=1 Tax=Actinocrinis sp. TaxID=1920516 RepID=UPI002CC0ABA6|nr:dihydrofolate reductase family protein [Actinocrinis sp.]HXR69481.1 dihydrofolate reductase family protein [Actinocrinis sp.]